MSEAAKQATTTEQRFVAAWGDVKNPELDGKNPHFNNRYATLKSTLGVIREACKANGIAYMQRLERSEYGYMLKSSVSDGSHSMDMSEFPMETPPNPQSFGSNLTYTKRQQAQADWCITGEEDDDGNAAAAACKSASQPRKPSNGTKPRQYQKPARKADEGRFAKVSELKAAVIERGIKEESIKEWLDARFEGKKMRDFNGAEIKLVEVHLQSLIESADELAAEKEARNV